MTSRAPFVLAIDIGTSSVRSLIYDHQGDVLVGTFAQYHYDLETTADGGMMSDPAEQLDLLGKCLDETLAGVGKAANEIAAVGFTTHWHNLLGLDAQGRPVTPVYHLGDNRSMDDVDWLRANLDEQAFRAIVGTMFHSSYWPAKLRWLSRAEPERFRATRRWSSIGDYAIRSWFGFDGMSSCMASGTGLLELSSGQWCQSLLGAIGVQADSLPPVFDLSIPITGLRDEQANRWPALASVPWFLPLGDGACANVGSGAWGKDRLALTLGTTGAVRIVEPGPIGSPLAPPPDLWRYRLDADYVVTGTAISNGGIVLSWLGDLLGQDETRLLDLAATVEPNSHGLTMLPFLLGERAPVWDDRARMVIQGFSLDSGPAELARASLESVALRLAALYDAIKPQLESDHLILANGGALLKSPLWTQICCDNLQHQVAMLSERLESAARGAALLALTAAGLHDSPMSATDPANDAVLLQPNPANYSAYLQARADQEQLLNMARGSEV